MNSQEMAKCLEIMRKSARNSENAREFRNISEKFHFSFQFFNPLLTLEVIGSALNLQGELLDYAKNQSPPFEEIKSALSEALENAERFNR